MQSGSSGLARDITLVKRRSWLFIPFFILGVIVALAFGRVAGDANAAATMNLETVVFDVFSGGDRGLRIFEAQSMAQDPAFKQKVLDATGLAPEGYARYAISLSPISVADGVSRGIMTVSIQDPKKEEAERLRNAWVNVFYTEYTSPDGLFRQRFIKTQQVVVDEAEKGYQDAIEKVKPIAAAHGVAVEDLVRSPNQVSTALADELTRQEAGLFVQQSQVRAALQSTPTGAIASAVLDRQVSDADAAQALQTRQRAVDASLQAVRDQKQKLSDASFTLEERGIIGAARQWSDTRGAGYARLNNARSAVSSAESHIETSYSFSGGVSGTILGRVAVVIAITLVFGLVAIYLLEWLQQLRRGTHESLT